MVEIKHIKCRSQLLTAQGCEFSAHKNINGALIFLTNVNLVLGLFYVLVVGQRQGEITAKLASTKKVATLQIKRKINE
jgi:hypothetical protein